MADGLASDASNSLVGTTRTEELLKCESNYAVSMNDERLFISQATILGARDFRMEKLDTYLTRLVVYSKLKYVGPTKLHCAVET